MEFSSAVCFLGGSLLGVGVRGQRDLFVIIRAGSTGEGVALTWACPCSVWCQTHLWCLQNRLVQSCATPVSSDHLGASAEIVAVRAEMQAPTLMVPSTLPLLRPGLASCVQMQNVQLGSFASSLLVVCLTDTGCVTSDMAGFIVWHSPPSVC